jgi:hypothetical protein
LPACKYNPEKHDRIIQIDSGSTDRITPEILWQGEWRQSPDFSGSRITKLRWLATKGAFI